MGGEEAGDAKGQYKIQNRQEQRWKFQGQVQEEMPKRGWAVKRCHSEKDRLVPTSWCSELPGQCQPVGQQKLENSSDLSDGGSALCLNCCHYIHIIYIHYIYIYSYYIYIYIHIIYIFILYTYIHIIFIYILYIYILYIHICIHIICIHTYYIYTYYIYIHMRCIYIYTYEMYIYT